MAETKLLEPPTDGISNVRFCQYESAQDLLLASSWDTAVRIYDSTKNEVKAKYNHKAPVLDACFTSAKSVASAGLDHAVKLYSLESGKETVLGAHSGPVRCVEWSDELGCVITGSWDSTVRLFDPRKPGAEAVKMSAPNKVYSMAHFPGSGMVIAATAERQLAFFDIRGGGKLQKTRESTLKHQTRAIRGMIDESGYILGSIEGRCAVEFVSDAEQARSKFAFKCHVSAIGFTTRTTGRAITAIPDQTGIIFTPFVFIFCFLQRQPDPAVPGEDRIFPVNAIAFNPVYGTFATGGGDGSALMWDHKAKKRLCKIRECETSVSALSFNKKGDKLAIAVSYTYEQGERAHVADNIIIKEMSEKEVKPK
jgi:cell cycle arrest protein BUB3